MDMPAVTVTAGISIAGVGVGVVDDDCAVVVVIVFVGLTIDGMDDCEEGDVDCFGDCHMVVVRVDIVG